MIFIFRILLLNLAVALVGSAAFGQDGSSELIKAKIEQKEQWKEYPTQTLASLKGFSPPKNEEKYSKYGGIVGKREKATGFFYTKKITGRWWLIDPDGYLFLSKGVNAVALGNSKSNKIALEKIGTERNWADKTSQMLIDKGFNAAGSWSRTDLLRRSSPRLPYTPIWNFMGEFLKESKLGKIENSAYYKGALLVFDPAFESFCDVLARKLAETKDDPYLLGHFSDNELRFREEALTSFLSLDKNNAGYKAAAAWLAERRKTATDITDDDRKAFLQFMAERYFRIVSKAIRKYDPNHLYIGSRMDGRVLTYDQVFTAIGKYTDVISVNYYKAWSPDLERMDKWSTLAKKPLMVTEWYARAMDMGLRNTTGVGWTVETQQARADFYQNFTLGLLRSRSCVGWHWFRYLDNDPEDMTSDPSNRDSNKGIVTKNYEGYKTLIDAMNSLNHQSYSLINYFDKSGQSK